MNSFRQSSVVLSVGPLARHNPRKIERHSPIWHADDFADAQIATDRTQHAGIDRIHVVAFCEKLDHARNGSAGLQKMVRTNSGCSFVTFDIKMLRHRARRCEARECEIGAFYEFELRGNCARAFNRRAARFTIALRSMGIANTEQSAFHVNWEIKFRASGKVADIEVATNAAGRNDRMFSGFGGCQPNYATKRLEWNSASRTI
jgi:hypothetical protein